MTLSFTLSSFAQSYLIFDNGTVITLDREGFIYDLGHYVFPNKVSFNRGHYYFEDNKILTTIGSDGTLYRKFEILPEVIKVSGSNYFISEKGELFTVDYKGQLKVITYEALLQVKHFGGNYFFVPNEMDSNLLDLFVVNLDGVLLKIETDPIQASSISQIGGQYFMLSNGDLYTVGASGELVKNTEYRVGVIVKDGGNYFVDSSGTIFTISIIGELKIPSVPFAFRTQLISRFGSQFFIDSGNNFYVVDSFGSIHQREIVDQNIQELRHFSH